MPVKTSLATVGLTSLLKGYGDGVLSVRRTGPGRAQGFKKGSVRVTDAGSVRPNFIALEIILQNYVGRARGGGPSVFDRGADEIDADDVALATTQRGRPVVPIVVDVASKTL